MQASIAIVHTAKSFIEAFTVTPPISGDTQHWYA